MRQLKRLGSRLWKLWMFSCLVFWFPAGLYVWIVDPWFAPWGYIVTVWLAVCYFVVYRNLWYNTLKPRIARWSKRI